MQKMETGQCFPHFGILRGIAAINYRTKTVKFAICNCLKFNRQTRKWRFPEAPDSLISRHTINCKNLA